MAEIGYDMERGYVKLWRKTLDSGLLQHPTALQVFMYLLLMTSHKKQKRIVAGSSVEVPAGSVLTGRAKLAAVLELSEKQVRTALGLLEKLEIVTIRRANKYSIISFVNWDRYQNEGLSEGPTDGTATGPGRGQVRATEQEIKNINIPPTLSSLRSERVSPTGDPAPTAEKPKRSSSASVSRKPPTPDEVQSYCDERCNGISGEHFCDYYAAQGWKLSNGQPLKDWKAAVRNWELRARERPKAAQAFFSRHRGMTDAERRQAHNDEVCRQVSAELDTMGGPF